MSDSDESGVTYTEVSSSFEDLSDIGSSRADDHEHLELPGMLEDPYVEVALQAPPSPDYIPSLGEPEQTPPLPDYVPGPEHADDEIVNEDASPTSQSPEEDRPEVTLPPRKRLAGGLRANYCFVATMDRQIRHDPEREVGYGITDFWYEIVETLQGAPVSTDTELDGYMREFKTRVRRDIDEIYSRIDDEQRSSLGYDSGMYLGESVVGETAAGSGYTGPETNSGVYTVMSDSEDSRDTYTKAPPSPDYVPGPEYPRTPEFVSGPVYLEFMPPEDNVLPAEEQPLPTDVSLTACCCLTHC
nr:hypothetical protein [Tanacetum cinerariifolium]